MRNPPLSSRPDFVPLPSDPDTPLTAEQESALFSGDMEKLGRDIVRLAQKQQADTAPEVNHA